MSATCSSLPHLLFCPFVNSFCCLCLCMWLVRLLSTQAGSRLLLADPPTRTAHNRERFLRLLQEQQDAAAKGKGVRQWEDREMSEGKECKSHPAGCMMVRLPTLAWHAPPNPATSQPLPPNPSQLLLCMHLPTPALLAPTPTPA